MKITVIDNFFPDKIAQDLLQFSSYLDWSFARTDGNNDTFWTKHLYGSEYKPGGHTEFEPKPIDNAILCSAWDFLKEKYDIEHKFLHSVYCNGITYGTEAHQHVDFNGFYGTTIICYLCDEWNSHWSGATNFYSGSYVSDFCSPVYYENEIIKSVLPKYNRVAIFDGNIIHSVAPLSKSFKSLRATLMFKLMNLNYEQVIKNGNA